MGMDMSKVLITEQETRSIRYALTAKAMKINSIKHAHGRGKLELLAYMEGKRITRSQAILGKCFECCNGYVDGRVDCNIPDCPLYPWMPFNSHPNTPKIARKPRQNTGQFQPRAKIQPALP